MGWMDVGIKQLSTKNEVWWCLHVQVRTRQIPGWSSREMTMPSPRRKRIQLLSALLLLLSCIAVPATAIYASQAGVVDWYVICVPLSNCVKVYSSSIGALRHHTWVGKARWSALTSPSRLVVSTERNMLASINTDTGAIGTRLFFYCMHVLFYTILMLSRSFSSFQ